MYLIFEGVCGRAAFTRTTQIVEDVHSFADHIACDSSTMSEIVVPLLVDGKVGRIESPSCLWSMSMCIPYKPSLDLREVLGAGTESCRC